MTVTDNPTEPAAKPWRTRTRQPFGAHVAATIGRLQERYLKKDSGAVAMLAQLRAAAGTAPGATYTVLSETHVPDKYLEKYLGDEPTDTEHAKHAALTLYALHQQSHYDVPMHRDGPGLGAAIGLLTHASESPDAVRRRFGALGTATTYNETLFHLRTLIRQLRDKKIGLDYGLLADDLAILRRPGGHDRVRALWGRDFYRTLPPKDSDDTTTTKPVESEE